MKFELKKYKEKVFDEIKCIDKDGNEYWYARELMKVLGYNEYRFFKTVINKSIKEIENKKGGEIK